MNAADWLEIGKWLTRLWVYFLCIVGFGFTFLAAHAIIPSLVSSGHLSQSALKLRPPMYATAFLLFAAAVVFMGLTVEKSLLLREFWDNFWL